MRRCEFIKLIGGAAVLPHAAHAQDRTKRVGVLMAIAETDPESKRLAGALEIRAAT
jgi:hypothetical protein